MKRELWRERFARCKNLGPTTEQFCLAESRHAEIEALVLRLATETGPIDKKKKPRSEKLPEHSLPILKEVIAKPRHFNWFRKAIETRRLFEGNPIAQEIADAENDLRLTMRPNPEAETVAKIESARQILMRFQDSEAANLATITLTYCVTKGNSAPVRKVGIEILQSRPRKSTIAFLQALLKSIHKTRDQSLKRYG